MKILKYLLAAVAISLLASCDKEDSLTGSNIQTEFERNEVDEWIYENLTKDYNIEVKYQFDDSEFESDKHISPPAIHQVIPFLEVLKKAWIEPYERAGGKDFIRRMIPKQIILAGSKNHNSDGTITQGTAEGGRKVVLYQINEFDKSDKAFLKRLFHIMHHEFGHILHQEILYPDEFKLVTPGGYTSGWMNVKLQDALNDGFISSYGKNIIDDDWVEIIAHMLTNSYQEYNAIVAQASPTGQYLLKQKENLVVGYYNSAWKIDLYALQQDISETINAITNE